MECLQPCILSEYCGEIACPNSSKDCIVYLEGQKHKRFPRFYQRRKLRALGYNLSRRGLEELAMGLKEKPK